MLNQKLGRSFTWMTALTSGILAIALLPSFAFASPPSPLDPAAQPAREINQLYQITFWTASIIFLIVQGLLIYAVLRYRNENPRFIPRQIHGSTSLEVAWTVVPSLILVALFGLMVGTMRDIAIPETTSMQINVVGHQWWWEFEYPEQGFTTGNELHIPVGEPVKVELTSNNVIHSFWVPQLNGKMDLIPGRTNVTWIQADEPGVYRGLCAELCGAQHANMTFLVVAQPQEEFDQWVANQQAPPVDPAAATDNEASLAAGKQAFLSGACIACHTIEGTIAQGKVGPNLTHFASRSTIAGLVNFENNPQNLRIWLLGPQAKKPLSKMPNPYLSQDDLNVLVEYLSTLK